MSEASVVSSPPALPLSEEKTGSLSRWQRVGWTTMDERRSNIDW